MATTRKPKPPAAAAEHPKIGLYVGEGYTAFSDGIDQFDVDPTTGRVTRLRPPVGAADPEREPAPEIPDGESETVPG